MAGVSKVIIVGHLGQDPYIPMRRRRTRAAGWKEIFRSNVCAAQIEANG